jgi:hypothetical protein
LIYTTEWNNWEEKNVEHNVTMGGGQEKTPEDTQVLTSIRENGVGWGPYASPLY